MINMSLYCTKALR